MALFYKPSRQYNSIGVFAIPVVAAAVSTLLAIPYSLAIWHNPIIYLGILLPVIWGLLVAMAVNALAVRPFKVRFPLLAVVLALLGSLVGFYVGWVAWIDLLFNAGRTFSVGSGRSEISVQLSMFNLEGLIEIGKNPVALFQVAKEVGENGVWSIKGQEVKGTVYYIVWAVEFLIYAFLICKVVASSSGAPFCEESLRWMSSKNYSHLALPASQTDREVLLSKIREGDISYFLGAESEADPGKVDHLELTFYFSDSGSDGYTSVNLKKKGKKDQGEAVLLKYLMVPQRQIDSLTAHLDTLG
jgi:hypothetical protein